MISRNSFFKLLKENRKHRVTSKIISVLFAGLAVLVAVLQLQNIILSEVNEEGRATLIKDIANFFLPHMNYILMFMAVGMGIYLAIDGFSYLHSKQKTDLYEALPLSRKMHFLVVMINSLWIFALPMTIALLLEGAMAGSMGYFSVRLLHNLVATFACSFCIFLMNYAVASLAMVLTGHSFVAFMGYLVFSFYAIFVRILCSAYASNYLSSYADSFTWDKVSDSLAQYLSPSILLAKLLLYDSNTSTWSFESHAVTIIASLLLALIAGILAYLLHGRRPAETAGNAMAFPRFNPVLRVAMAVVLALYAGLFLSLMASGYRTIWLLAGIILGSIFFCGFTEAVFQFDIKAAFTKKSGWLLTSALGIAFFAVFMFDLTGYNNWIPKENDVEAVTFKVGGEAPYIGSAIGSDSKFDCLDLDSYYKIKGLNGENKEKAFQLAAEMVKAAAESKQKAGFLNILSNGDNVIDNDSTYREVYFIYRMKNGNIEQRKYEIDMDTFEKKLDPLYASEEYKKDFSSLYSLNPDSIYEVDYSNGEDASELEMSQQDGKVFWEALKKDVTALTMTEVNEDIPIASLTLYCKDTDGGHQCYIYPSYVNTIEALKTKGVTVKAASLKNTNISSMEISNVYTESGDNFVDVMITDPEIIEKYKSKLVISDYAEAYNYTTNAYFRSPYTVGVYFAGDGEGEDLHMNANSEYVYDDDNCVNYKILEKDGEAMMKEAEEKEK